MIAAVVQARMGSTRLPGKVMAEIMGKPLLWHLISRLKRSKLIDKIVVATTKNEKDKPILELAEKVEVNSFAGNEEDVLDRYYMAATRFEAKSVVRITSDCPILDPSIVDTVVELFLQGKYNLVSNVNPPTFPDGLDVEVLSFATLERTWHEAHLTSEREHVTPYIYKHPEIFRIGNVSYKEDLSGLRWTVDEARDLEFVRAIFKYLNGTPFNMGDVLKILEIHPEVLTINAGVRRNEGYEKSLANDELSRKK